MDNYIILNDFNYGCGNILFQFFYARLLSEKFNIKFFHPYIPLLDIKSNMHLLIKNKYKTVDILDFSIQKLDKTKNYKVYYFRYQEDYKFWKPHLEFVRTIYKNCIQIKERNNEDLVLHLRAGNDWINSNFYSIPDAKSFQNLLEKIKFKKLYIVTNCKKYENWTMQDLLDLQEKFKKEGGDGDHKSKYIASNYPWRINDEVLDKINGILSVLNKYDPVWVSGSVNEDFKFMCKFDKIVLSPSTFSWWAGVLGCGKEIYAYKTWKNKGYIKINYRSKCKNLGETNYNGWHSWE